MFGAEHTADLVFLLAGAGHDQTTSHTSCTEVPDSTMEYAPSANHDTEAPPLETSLPSPTIQNNRDPHSSPLEETASTLPTPHNSDDASTAVGNCSNRPDRQPDGNVVSDDSGSQTASSSASDIPRRLQKRKLSYIEKDEINDNPDLYGLRRSVSDDHGQDSAGRIES